MYVDPGFGLFIVQAIVSAVLGLLFVGRSYIRRVTSRLFGRGKSAEAVVRSETDADKASDSADVDRTGPVAERKSRVG